MKTEHTHAPRALHQLSGLGARPEIESGWGSFMNVLRGQEPDDAQATADVGLVLPRTVSAKEPGGDDQWLKVSPADVGESPATTVPTGLDANAIWAWVGVDTRTTRIGELTPTEGALTLSPPEAQAPAVAPGPWPGAKTPDLSQQPSVDASVEGADEPARAGQPMVVDPSSAALQNDGAQQANHQLPVAPHVHRLDAARVRAMAERYAGRDAEQALIGQTKADGRQAVDGFLLTSGGPALASTATLFGMAQPNAEGGPRAEVAGSTPNLSVSTAPVLALIGSGAGSDAAGAGDASSPDAGASGKGSPDAQLGGANGTRGTSGATVAWSDGWRAANAPGGMPSVPGANRPWAMADAAALGNDIRLWVSDQLQAADVRVDVGGKHPVDVRVVLQGRHAQVQVASEAPAVREWLQRASGQLDAALQAQGLALSGFEVSAQAAWQSGAGGGQSSGSSTLSTYGSPRGAGAGKAATRSEPVLGTIGPVARRITHEGRLDLFA